MNDVGGRAGEGVERDYSVPVVSGVGAGDARVEKRYKIARTLAVVWLVSLAVLIVAWLMSGVASGSIFEGIPLIMMPVSGVVVAVVGLAMPAMRIEHKGARVLRPLMWGTGVIFALLMVLMYTCSGDYCGMMPAALAFFVIAPVFCVCALVMNILIIVAYSRMGIGKGRGE